MHIDPWLSTIFLFMILDVYFSIVIISYTYLSHLSFIYIFIITNSSVILIILIYYSVFYTSIYICNLIIY